MTIMRLHVSVVTLCAVVCSASAAVDLPWSTTYDCPDWTQNVNQITCDGLSKAGGWTAQGQPEQITADANNPCGAGGKGQRHWVQDGANQNSGGTGISFNDAQPELWIRWYMRYSAGFKWAKLSYDKWLYLIHGPSPDYRNSAVPEFEYENGTRIYAVPSHESYRGGGGWRDTMGGPISDGQFHCYEVHLKVDANGADGIAELWVDGNSLFSVTNANYGTHAGWTRIMIGHNQSTPDNGGPAYVDFDDIAINSTGYIGPIPVLNAPSGLKVRPK